MHTAYPIAENQGVGHLVSKLIFPPSQDIGGMSHDTVTGFELLTCVALHLCSCFIFGRT